MPYLRLYDSGSGVYVYCDGYYIRFFDNTATNIFRVYNLSDVVFLNFYDMINDGSNPYFSSYGQETFEILENTSTRVVIRITGNYDMTSGGGNPLTNSDKVTFTFYIYPDRFFVDWVWEISGAITINYANMLGVDGETGNLTNANNYYENSGSESTPSDSTYYDNAKYLAMVADEIGLVSTVHYNPDSFLRLFNVATGRILIRTQADPTGAYTYKVTALHIIDSAQRAYGQQLYDSTDRLSMGDQYKDTAVLGMGIGTSVEDLKIPYQGGNIIFNEQFEATGYDETSAGIGDNWSETLGGGTIDEDYPVSSVIGAPSDWGSKCLRMVNASAGQEDYMLLDASYSDAFYFRLDFIIPSFATVTSSPYKLFELYDAAISNYFRVMLWLNGSSNPEIYFTCNNISSGSAFGNTEISANMRYRIDGYVNYNDTSYEFRINGISKASGSSTATLEPRRIYLISYVQNGYTIYFKNIQISTEDWIPSSLASDGVVHIEPNTYNITRKNLLTWDRARKRPVVVTHDWPFLSGGLPDNHLLTYYKCNDNAASSQVTDYSGNDDHGVWRLASDDSARNTNSSGDSVDGIRDKAFDTQDGTGYIDIPCGSGEPHDNAFYLKGTVIVKFKPQFSYDDGTAQVIFNIQADGYLRLQYSSGGDKFQIAFNFGAGQEVGNQISAYTSDLDLQQWHTIHGYWDFNRKIFGLVFNGEVHATGITTQLPDSTEPSHCTIGIESGGTFYPDIIIDEGKTYDACIMPYGAYHIGNGAGLLADIDNPHSDIIFYWDCQASGSGAAKGGSGLTTDYTITLNGSAAIVATDPIIGIYHLDTVNVDDDVSVTVTNSDIIDPKHGSLSIWVNFQTAPDPWDYFLGIDGGSTDNMLQLGTDSNGYFRLEYYANAVNTSVNATFGPTTGVWYHIKASWSDSDNNGEVKFWVNGVFAGRTVCSNIFYPQSNATLYIGANHGSAGGTDCFIGNIAISNNPNTPQIWTNFGKPLWMPLVRDNN